MVKQLREGLRRFDGVLDHVMLYSPSVGMTAERVEKNLASLIEACAPAAA